jgi:hypothetical protein
VRVCVQAWCCCECGSWVGVGVPTRLLLPCCLAADIVEYNVSLTSGDTTYMQTSAEVGLRDSCACLPACLPACLAACLPACLPACL